MRQWLSSLFMIIVILTPWTTVRAQNPPEIERLQVDLWPEFDRKEVLVIYHITLTATTSMPAQIALRIPKAAGSPYNLAMKDVDGMLYNVKYDQTVDGDWLRISFTAPSAELQLEYYDPSLARTGNNRSFSYRWSGDYRVRSMLVRIQQPVNASDFQLINSPLKLGAGSKADDGLTYYNVPIDGIIESGTPFGVQFGYSKPDDTLSSPDGVVQPRPASGSTTALNGSLAATNSSLIWLALGAGLALILFGGFWYYQQQRASSVPAASSRRRHNYSTQARSTSRAESSSIQVYCHQCGKRASPGDAFCRACGVKLKISD